MENARARSLRRPGPGEAGFVSAVQKNLNPGEGMPEKQGASGKNEVRKKDIRKKQ